MSGDDEDRKCLSCGYRLEPGLNTCLDGRVEEIVPGACDTCVLDMKAELRIFSHLLETVAPHADVLLAPGSMTEVHIHHQDSCPFTPEAGPQSCTCKPEIKTVTLRKDPS